MNRRSMGPKRSLRIAARRYKISPHEDQEWFRLLVQKRKRKTRKNQNNKEQRRFLHENDEQDKSHKNGKRRSRNTERCSQQNAKHFEDEGLELELLCQEDSRYIRDAVFEVDAITSRPAISPEKLENLSLIMLNPPVVTREKFDEAVKPFVPTARKCQELDTEQDVVFLEVVCNKSAETNEITLTDVVEELQVVDVDDEEPEILFSKCGVAVNMGDGDSSCCKLSCRIDKNMTKYQLLQNAEMCEYIQVPDNSKLPNITYIKSDCLCWTSLNPGLHITVTFDTINIRTGMLLIEPRNVKPFERVHSGDLVLLVVHGCVRIKSSGVFDRDAEGQRYLKPFELCEKSSAYLAKDTVYSIENWCMKRAMISFTIIRDMVISPNSGFPNLRKD